MSDRTEQQVSKSAPVLEVLESELLRYGGWTAANILDIDLLKKKIAAGADVQSPVMNCPEGSFPLGLAARYGNAEACRVLLSAGADPNKGYRSFGSPLLEVVGARKLSRIREEPPMSDEAMREVVAVLISHGTNPNGCRRSEREMQHYDSPLLEAVYAKDHALVRELVKHGADLEMKIEWIKHDKAFSRVTDVATVLAHIANIPDQNGKVSLGDQDMMITLLRLGADDARLGRRYTEVTPLQQSVAMGRDKLVEYYVRERGEDLAQRVEGRTLAQIARNPGTRALLKALKTELAVQHGVDTQDGGTPRSASPKKHKALESL